MRTCNHQGLGSTLCQKADPKTEIPTATHPFPKHTSVWRDQPPRFQLAHGIQRLAQSFLQMLATS